MRPAFTIVTATRGRPEELREAVVSALEQDFGDFEHLVVDDASPDGAAADVVAELRDERLRLLRLEESRGPAGARNAALREARGDLVAILDDDDAMLPGRLRRSAEFLGGAPEHVLVAGAFDAVDADGTVHATVRPPTGEERIRAILPRHNPFCHSTVTVRRTVLDALGGYREALRYSHDYDMVLRAAERGRIEILPERLGRYRFHARNISAARCFLQGAYARVAQECARRRRRGEEERLEELVAEVSAPANGAANADLARARVHYQIGEWMFRDGRAKAARPHLGIALRAEPLRPLCLGLAVAAWTPAWLRRLLGPVVRPLVAMRYPSWK